MSEHVTIFNAEVVAVWRNQILKIASYFITKLEPDFALCGTTRHDDFVASVLQANPLKSLKSVT
jgi:hypothetical protein